MWHEHLSRNVCLILQFLAFFFCINLCHDDNYGELSSFLGYRVDNGNVLNFSLVTSESLPIVFGNFVNFLVHISISRPYIEHMPLLVIGLEGIRILFLLFPSLSLLGTMNTHSYSEPSSANSPCSHCLPSHNDLGGYWSWPAYFNWTATIISFIFLNYITVY